MSRTVVTYPINGCLKGAGQMLGAIKEWVHCNPIQARYLADYFAAGGGEVAKIPEMKTKASRAAAEINAFLKENGFTLEIEQLAPDQFAVASLIKVLVEWLVEGKKTTVEHGGQQFPAVNLTDKAAQVEILAAPKYGGIKEIVKLPTKSGDTVYLTALNESWMTDIDLADLARGYTRNIQSGMARPFGRYEGVIFPMVDLDLTYDLDWLVGLTALPANGDDPAMIEKAIQQSRLKMNHKGALAESAAVVTMRCLSLPPPPLVINEPFLCWFERPGLSQPLFVAHVTPEDWKDPGEIEGLE